MEKEEYLTLSVLVLRLVIMAQTVSGCRMSFVNPVVVPDGLNHLIDNKVFTRPGYHADWGDIRKEGK